MVLILIAKLQPDEPIRALYRINGQRLIKGTRYWELYPSLGEATGRTLASMEDFPQDEYDKIDERFEMDVDDPKYYWEKKDNFWILKKK